MDTRGYAAAYQHLESLAQSFDPQPSYQRQQMNHNNPCSTNYNPNGESQHNTYNPTLAGNAPMAAQHHSLLLASFPPPNPAMAMVGGPQNVPALTMNFGNNHAFDAFSLAPAPLPTAPPPQPQHKRHSSFEEFLLMNPGLLSGSALNPLPIVSSTNTSVAPSSSTSSAEHEPWLEDLKLHVPGLSVEPLSGSEIVRRLRSGMDDVVTRYLPCVHFLVDCQQELRKGLTFINLNRQRHRGRSQQQATQYFAQYVQPLPQRFQIKNQFVMDASALQTAVAGLHDLVGDARNAQRHGCETVKNQFLGGMKDGESWGLRKWLSRNGNALRICTDVECILSACQKLDRKAESTRKLAEILRPLAEQALQRLKTEIPVSYQEHSSAHPYLPFFHRLESALRGMSQYNPEDDGVIEIDDSDDDEPPPPPPPVNKAMTPSKKRKAGHGSGVSSKRFTAACTITDDSPSPKMEAPPTAAARAANDDSSSGESDDESVIEIVGVKVPASGTAEPKEAPATSKEWRCTSCLATNVSTSDTCHNCGETDYMRMFGSFDEFMGGSGLTLDQALDSKLASSSNSSTPESTSQLYVWPLPVLDEESLRTAAIAMARNIDKVAETFEKGQQLAVRPQTAPYGSFWDGACYGAALRLLSDLLRLPECLRFVERVDEDRLIEAGNPPFSHVIKHPIGFRDIVSALIRNVESENLYPCGMDGRLPVRGLSSWNMWKGVDFLQAVDLVFLNSLAYGKQVEEGKSAFRAKTNKVRKRLWDGINNIISSRLVDPEKKKLCTPTRRSATSGFVVYKIQER